MTRKARPTVLTIAADDLNEKAGYIEREELLPNYDPPYPTIWFDGLARELRNLRGTSWEDLLTPAARERFRAVTA